ncbi:hypothetical protein G4D82_13890 [Flavobacterium sp. CYK-4]|uniref:carboxypeptidase-like regulatory domain-containing protein n=1 Tax=Flavobacterium lotistagni TaxID=2709660 RepID=UPI0014088CA7|nr:carboxypeptidase-like regulatory domain-containing protein [Flavobacterium lotistagni]NHM08315.1 hypothetical protein [Flavobacterium lotistagni]
MKYRIEIPKPCNENWSQMTPTERGMFCSNCKKEVIDFTHFSNYELAKRINKEQNICGRFLPSQINTELNFSNSNRIQKLAIFFGFSSLFLTSPIFSQIPKPNIEIVEKDSIEKIIPQNNYIEISGIVADKTGPLPGANIIQKNTSNSVQADFDGKFVIKIPIEDFEEKVFLRFQFIGMKEVEKQVFKIQKELYITLPEGEGLTGEVVIVKKKNIFRRISNLFR